MFDRILTMIRKDLRTGGRDQIVLYMLVSPILLGVGLAVLMPVLERATPGFAVDAGLSEARIEALAKLGPIERFESRAEVEQRVLERDDVIGVIGVVGAADGYEVVIEGDEPEAVRALPAAAIEHGVELEAVAPGPSPLRKISTALLSFCITVVVGLMLGFAILEEKQTETHRVYDVSPLRFGEYLAGKLGLGLVLALGLVIPAVALPIGLHVDWLAIFALTIAGLPFGLALGLIVGFQAKDQLGAIAVMKALLPIWTSLPVMGFLLPDAWMWTQWPFANHWCVQGLYVALGNGGSIVREASLALLTGLPVLIATAWILRRRIGFT